MYLKRMKREENITNNDKIHMLFNYIWKPVIQRHRLKCHTSDTTYVPFNRLVMSSLFHGGFISASSKFADQDVKQGSQF